MAMTKRTHRAECDRTHYGYGSSCNTRMASQSMRLRVALADARTHLHRALGRITDDVYDGWEAEHRDRADAIVRDALIAIEGLQS